MAVFNKKHCKKKHSNVFQSQMKRFSLVLVFLMVFCFTACNEQSNPDVVGKNLFAALKTLSSSDTESSQDKLAKNFLKKEDGYNLFQEIKNKSYDRGVSDWSKIEYVNFIHKEVSKNGVKYSSGCLIVNLNGKGDYVQFSIYLLNIQVGNEYKVLKHHDNWSRDTTIPWDRLKQNLDEILEKWID